MAFVAVVGVASGVLSVLHLDQGPVKVLNDETVSPGTVGSIVMGIIIVAVVFLLRSFFKQVRRVPWDREPFDEPADAATPSIALSDVPDDPAGVVPSRRGDEPPTG